MNSVFEFDRAIVREPGQSVINGIRDGNGESPCYPVLLDVHRSYVATLRTAGLDVTVLTPLEAYPDSVFVEDPALVFSEGAILLKPGAAARAGEVAPLATVLREEFEQVLSVEAGHVDGGDVMVTPDTVLIGLSARTDREGASALSRLLEQLGKRAVVSQTPKGTLHFKSGSALVDEETVLVTSALAEAEVFARYRTLIVPCTELGGANALRVNDTVLAGAEYPRTIEMLESHGLKVVPLPVAEIGKIDAGLTCMSLRWKR